MNADEIKAYLDAYTIESDHKEPYKHVHDYDNKGCLINCIIARSIKEMYLHPVTFKLVTVGDNFTAEAGHEFKWNDVLFEQENLVITTDYNGNDDARGGGCGNLNIDISEFKWGKNCPGGITVYDLTEAAYRMKGSKYDHWYELFNEITLETQDDAVIFKISFDYGS
jgi:hypothetical protein